MCTMCITSASHVCVSMCVCICHICACVCHMCVCVCMCVCHILCVCVTCVCVYVCMYACMYVCVNHLNRCKTSTMFLQGDHPCTVSDGPTKRPQYMRISRLITVTYLLHFFDVNVQKWRPAKPRTGTSTNWSSNSFFARFFAI